MWIRVGFSVSFCCEMNPSTNSGYCWASLTVCSTYMGLIRLPLELNWASSSSPFPLGTPAFCNPSMMPGPGSACALVRCAQSLMRYTPPVYCKSTVFPISANFRSSKRIKLCLSASWRNLLGSSGVKSEMISIWVFKMHM